MSDFYTYSEIVAKANSIKKGVPKKYELVENPEWVYYICRAILTPKKNIKKIKIATAPKPSGDNLSRQIMKDDYLDMARRLIKFVDTNKVLPNYIICQHKKVKMEDYVYMFSRVLVYYFNNNNTYPKYAEVNSKAFIKPVEYKNEVYKYFVQKTGKKYTTIDDLLEYVQKNFKYEYYYDDKKSNKQVIDTRAGNCTDLLQFLCNMAEEMGYSWKCIHVKCRQSGSGHVFGKFKHPKNTNGKWITRDIASVSDGGSITSVWCENGIVLAENPSWWLQNLHR